MKLPIVASVIFVGLVSVQAQADGLESKLQKHALNPQEIAEKCKASIQAKADMVSTVDENGKSERVPRCVMLYRASSQSASSYINDIRQAVEEVAANAPNCDANATQQGCLEAGKKLIERAASTHAQLAQKAEEIETKFDDFQLPEANSEASGEEVERAEPSSVAAARK